MNRDDSGRFESKSELSDDYREYFEDYAEWVTVYVDKDRTYERLKTGVKA